MQIVVVAVVVLVVIAVVVFMQKKTVAGAQTSTSPLQDFDARQFEADLRGYFSGKGPGWEVHVDEDYVSGPGRQIYGLSNLRQVYRLAPPEQRKAAIVEHFDIALGSKAEERAALSDVSDFGKAKEFLAVRLYPSDYLQQITSEYVIYREDLAGCITALVFDLPTYVRGVKPQEARPWNQSVDTLFELALKSTLERYPLQPKQVTLFDKVSVWQLYSENFFASAHVLNLQAHPQCLGKYGAIVAIPSRQIALAYPVNDTTVIQAINFMIPAVQRLFDLGPGSITPNIYWHHETKFLNLPYKLEDKRLIFTPPPEFFAMLNQLLAPAGQR